MYYYVQHCYPYEQCGKSSASRKEVYVFFLKKKKYHVQHIQGSQVQTKATEPETWQTGRVAQPCTSNASNAAVHQAKLHTCV